MNNMSSKWTPGNQRGRSVKVLYTLPVKFKLEARKSDKAIVQAELIEIPNTAKEDFDSTSVARVRRSDKDILAWSESGSDRYPERTTVVTTSLQDEQSRGYPVKKNDYEAKKSKAYIVYANGSVSRTKSFLGIKNFPKVEPGAEIFIPKKPERRKLSPTEVVAIASGLGTIALIINNLTN